MHPRFLDGIRFVDLTWAGAGPFSTKLFSDFGADVVKIESRSRPDPVRIGGPYRNKQPGINRSGYFASRNTGKRSLAMNLKHPDSREILFALIREADVVSNNFGPGAMERLGLSYDQVRSVKPDIIYLGMPMYGEGGPRASLTGVGMTISAVSGLMWQTGYEGGDPLGPGTHFPDHAANPYHAAFAVIAALRHRRVTGNGMKIDLSQVESTINCMGLPCVEVTATGEEQDRIGNRSRFHAPHNIFRCAGEDSWCAIAVLDDMQWQALAHQIGGDPSLVAAERLAQVDRVEAAVAAWTASRQATDVMTTLQSHRIPAGVVASSRFIMDEDRQLAHRGYFQTIDHPEIGESRFTSPPFLLDGERVELRRPPLLGEHNEDVLCGILNYSKQQVQQLQAQGVLE